MTPPEPASPTTVPPRAWDRLVEATQQRRRVTWMMLTRNATPVAIADGRIVLELDPAAAKAFHNAGHHNVVADAAQDIFGGNWTVEVREATS